jgi:hypothetical protein
MALSRKKKKRLGAEAILLDVLRFALIPIPRLGIKNLGVQKYAFALLGCGLRVRLHLDGEDQVKLHNPQQAAQMGVGVT